MCKWKEIVHQLSQATIVCLGYHTHTNAQAQMLLLYSYLSALQPHKNAPSSNIAAWIDCSDGKKTFGEKLKA